MHSFLIYLAAFILILVLLFLLISLKGTNTTKSKKSNIDLEYWIQHSHGSSIESQAKPDLNDEELIAVLTAAAAAIMAKPVSAIKVNSFRHVPQTSPIWNNISKLERVWNKL
jgi:glutaconyl-CoA/methylmalonyl-CoA decarboxylase subunit delta